MQGSIIQSIAIETEERKLTITCREGTKRREIEKKVKVSEWVISLNGNTLTIFSQVAGCLGMLSTSWGHARGVRSEKK